MMKLIGSLDALARLPLPLFLAVALVLAAAGLRLFGAPPNLHLLSTAGLLGGLEKAGVIPSADKVPRDMRRTAGR